MQPNFAFLALAEHPFAREMLSQLLAAGHAPSVIVVEDSELASVERDKFLERIAGYPVAAPLVDQASSHDIPALTVPKHTSEAILDTLDHRPLDLIVLGGTRIIRGPVLSHPREGVINSHPGLLPDCRGSASPAWSIYHDIPIGSSTHFCDENIDTGDLLLRRELPVKRGASYEDLCYGTLVLCATLMAEALTAFVKGEWPELRRPQGSSQWPTFRNAPAEVLATVRDRLSKQTYVHYVD